MSYNIVLAVLSYNFSKFARVTMLYPYPCPCPCFLEFNIKQRKNRMWTIMDAIRESKTVIFINYITMLMFTTTNLTPKLINVALISIH